MIIFENGNFGNCVIWRLLKMEIVENENCGKWLSWKWKLWKMEMVENGNCGKWKLWKMEIVENGN